MVGDVEGVGALELRDLKEVAYITQTTLSVDDTREVIAALRRRFPKIVGPDVKDICYATQNRQSAVRSSASIVDLVLVVGAQNSSNASRLCEVGNDVGVPTHLVEEPSALDPTWLEGKKSVCITAGASTPEDLVQDVVERLGEYAPLQISTMDGVENVKFGPPVELGPDASGTGRASNLKARTGTSARVPDLVLRGSSAEAPGSAGNERQIGEQECAPPHWRC